MSRPDESGRKRRRVALPLVTRVGLPRPTGTAIGLAVLGTGVLGAAVNTGNNLLYLLFGILVAALPVSLSASIIDLVRLEVEPRLPPAPRAGTPFRIEIRVRNRHRFLAARGLRLTVVTRRGNHGPALIESVPPGETRRVALVVRHCHRGPQQLVGVRVTTMFPLGFIRRRRFFRRADELLVLPALTPVSGPSARAHGEVGPSGRSVRADGIEYEGLRRGRDEDDARRVDWKATARSGRTMVRETTGEGRPVLDLELSSHRSETPLARARRVFEDDASRVAGAARHVLAAGGVVHLALDGQRLTFSGLGGQAALQRRLARLVPVDRIGRPLPPLPPVPVPRRGMEGLRELPPGRAHARSSMLALATSAAALFAYGGIGPVAFALLALAMGAALFTDLPARLQARGFQILWRAAAAGALFFYVGDLLVWRHNPLSASLALIVFITLYKLFNSRTVSDDRQVLLVSLLQMVLAAALTTGVSFILPLLVWLFAVTHAQVAWTSLPRVVGDVTRPALFSAGAGGALRYGRPSAGLTLAQLAVGALVFVAVPHVGTGVFDPGGLRGNTTSGFSESTTLGDIGRIKLSTARVMEVSLPSPPPAGADLRWKGLALDRFDGRTWSRSDTDLGWMTADGRGRFSTRDAASEAAGALIRQEIRLEPGQGRVMFALPSAEIVESEDLNFLALDFAGSLFFARPPRKRITYAVSSRLPVLRPPGPSVAAPEEPAWLRRRYLHLPDVDARIPELAGRLVDGTSTRLEGARAIESWLSANKSYSLDVRDAGLTDPLASFLFEDMPAHCEYFASSMVVLARAAGIPTRYVAGYLRGEKSHFGERYTVRQSDAHAWVEVHVVGVGWVPFDPTPPAGRGDWDQQGILDMARDVYGTMARWWDDYVIGIDINDQARAFLGLRDALASRLGRLEALLSARAALLTAAILVVLTTVTLTAYRNGLELDLRAWWPRGGRLAATRTPAFYRGLQRLLRRRGLVRRAGETPAEFAERVSGALPDGVARRVRELTDVYYRVRFDALADERRGRRLGHRLLVDVRQELRRARG